MKTKNNFPICALIVILIFIFAHTAQFLGHNISHAEFNVNFENIFTYESSYDYVPDIK